MKIVQVVHAFPPDIGGIESHVLNLSRELVKKGHDVTVVTSKTKGATANENIDGMQVIRYTSISLPLFSSVKIIPCLTPRLMLLDADVYHSHGYGSTQPFFTSLATLFKRKPFVFTLHGYPRLKGISGLFKWFYSNIPARVFLSIASAVITVTDATIPDIRREVDNKKIVSIPNGVDFSRFRPAAGPQTKTIAYIGRFDAYKGIDTLIRSFSIIKKKHPDSKLVLIGKDEGVLASLRALASELNIDFEHIEAKPEQMPELYKQLSVVVLPSKYEGLSLVILETIASGRPMLSTPVGAAPTVFSQVYKEEAGKFLFDIEDHLQLADKLSDILANTQRYEKICAAARERLMQSYSWSSAAEKTIQVYEKVTGAQIRTDGQPRPQKK